MRSGPMCPALMGGASVAVWAPAHASETYTCADGTTLHVTSQNRAEMNDHPCIKDWFEQSRQKAKAAREANPPDNPRRVAVVPWRSYAFASPWPSGYNDSGPLLMLSIYPSRSRSYCPNR